MLASPLMSLRFVALSLVQNIFQLHNEYLFHELYMLNYICVVFQESYDKEFEEKKAEYQVKVLELYEASSAEVKVR